MIKRSCILLLLSISTIASTHAMQQQKTVLDLPELLVYNILRYFSTQQILHFRQVSKQAQQVAENLLQADSSKKILVKINAELPPKALLQKVTGLELHLGSNHKVHKYSTYGNSLTSLADIGIELQFDSDHEDCAYFTPAHSITSLISNISHIKALNLKILNYLYYNTESINMRIAQQLKNIESLKIQHPPVIHSLTYSPDTPNYHSTRFDLHNYTVDVLNTIPTYMHLKKLHITKATIPWETIVHILPQLCNLLVLHIEGNRSLNKAHFYAFIEALQQLTLLQKLCLYITTIKRPEANALGRSLAKLANVQVLNLRKTSISQKDITILRQKCPHIPTIHYSQTTLELGLIAQMLSQI